MNWGVTNSGAKLKRRHGYSRDQASRGFQLKRDLRSFRGADVKYRQEDHSHVCERIVAEVTTGTDAVRNPQYTFDLGHIRCSLTDVHFRIQTLKDPGPLY